ncbi:hypothetical protein DOY81_010215 [Sarcophaga bullata]|nr:hypothetical protein DOY81_010215 [Sarcophaga bullata]
MHGWTSIAEETGESVERCQHRWRSLRDRYVRELMIKSKTGSSAGTRWVFMDALSFLHDHVAPYSRTISKRESTSSEPQMIEVNPLEESDSCPLNSYLSCCFDDTSKFSPLLESPIPSQPKRHKLPDKVVPQCKAHEKFEALCSAVNDLLETKKVTEKSRNADFFKVLDSYLLKHTEEDQDKNSNFRISLSQSQINHD